MDKLANRVSGRQGKFYSNSEKLVLVRQVLSAIRLFELMVTIANKWAEVQLNKLQQPFF